VVIAPFPDFKESFDRVLKDIAETKDYIAETKDDIAKVKDDIAETKEDIAEAKDKISDLDGKFNHVYSKELRPIPASEVSVEQFDEFSFRVFRVEHFVASIMQITARNIQFKNVLLLFTNRIISLVHDNVAQVDEVMHIQPISREVLRELLKCIIEEDSVDNSSLHHVQVQDEISFVAKNVNNKNYCGKIDEGVVDTVMSICVLPWEDKNPMKKVTNSKPVTQESNPFVKQGKLTGFCKKALAQSALQIISQVQGLDDIWGLFKQPVLYGILTNGLEWFVVAHEAGRWRRSEVINTTKISSTGSLIVDEQSISYLAKAIYKVLLNAIVWCRRLVSTNTCEKNGDADDGKNDTSHYNGGNKKTDTNNDENDEGAGGGGGDSLSRGLKKLSCTTNATNEKGDGTKFANRKAFKDIALTVENVELFARQSRTASHRKMLELYS